MKKSKTCGLIGKNIDYSFSKRFFIKKFEEENLNHSYTNFDVKNLSNIESDMNKVETEMDINRRLCHNMRRIS